MLTSVFYTSFYRPYIVSEANNTTPTRRARINTNRDAEAAGRIFVLNKSVQSEILSHAQSITTGVTDLRQSTGRMAHDMENFNRTVHREGWSEAVDGLVRNLSRFAGSYNQSVDFMGGQPHSAGLRAFSEEVVDNVFYNRGRLEMLGLSLNENSRLQFSESQVRNMSYAEVNASIGENIEIFEGLRAYTTQMLTEPLVEHMQFRGLSYHYNYQLGRMETEGYNLIEAGMLVDRVV